MLRHLLIVRRQVLLLILLTFLVTPVVGLGAAQMFGLISHANILQALRDGWLPLFMLVLVLWTGIHFYRFPRALIQLAREQAEPQLGTDLLHNRLKAFPRHYWSLFLLYSLVTPVTLYFSIDPPLTPVSYFHILSLLLACSILIGLPAYLLVIDRLGRLSSHFGCKSPQQGMQNRLLLLSGLVPLLGYTLLFQYYWLHRNSTDLNAVVVWTMLVALSVLATIFSIRSIRQSLRPVMNMLRHSGAITHDTLTHMRPASSDEIGYLTQTISQTFRKAVMQEERVRAVVDNAAEGIIVVDNEGLIEMFNHAAEAIFGYRAEAVRGKPVSWILPDLSDMNGMPVVHEGGHEINAMTMDGARIILDIRASEISAGESYRTVYLIDDITSQRMNEEKRRHAETRYRNLVETAHDLVWTMDAEGKWVYLNKASKDIYGHEPLEMFGRPVADFQVDEYREQENAAFRAAFEGRELYQFETVHRDKYGQHKHLSFNAKAQYDENGRVTRLTGTARDITEKKRIEQRLTYQAEHDVLTGLFNRVYFQQELERVIARVARNTAQCGLLYIDLDQFKYINDTLGHAAGDRLLVELARHFSRHVREGELLARFGGDEFTALLYDIDREALLSAADKFRMLLENYKFIHEGKSYSISCSIGAVLIDAASASADEALSQADIACNLAKSRGRNCVNIYDPDDIHRKDSMAEDMGWAERVRNMLENNRFTPAYQPIVDARSGRIHDYEVLMRMPCDDGQVILPGGFMPAAERFGLIHMLDRWMVESSIRRLHDLHRDGNDVRFSINLSGQAFGDDLLLPLIRRLLDETGLEPSLLTFEITETEAISNLEAATAFINQLNTIGCRFSLDDFGSGFCSFTYLKHLPVDALKIDGSFIRDIANSLIDQEMVRAMNQIAHALGKTTIAECVEDRRTMEILREVGVDYVQGNYLSQPLDDIPHGQGVTIDLVNRPGTLQ